MKKISIIEEILTGRINDVLQKTTPESENCEENQKLTVFLQGLEKEISYEKRDYLMEVVTAWTAFHERKGFRNGARFGFFLALELMEDWKG